MKNNTVPYIFKGISLIILDVITFMMIFSVWALVNIQLFPWAFIAILFSLVLVNVVILLSRDGVMLLGVGVYASTAISTILYYLFVMVFTGISYISISTKWYMIIFLIATLIYFAIISGLYAAGVNKSKDVIRQMVEKENVLDVNLQLMDIMENIKSCSSTIEKASYMAVIAAYDDMEERLKSSTPFGRTIKPIVLKSERQIIDKLYSLNEEVILLKTMDESEMACNSIIKVFLDVKALIINREKLIIQ